MCVGKKEKTGIADNASGIKEVKFTDMENKIKEILQDYMTERQIKLALPRLVNLISGNLPVMRSVCDHSLPYFDKENFWRCEKCGEILT